MNSIKCSRCGKDILLWQVELSIKLFKEPLCTPCLEEKDNERYSQLPLTKVRGLHVTDYFLRSFHAYGQLTYAPEILRYT